MHAIMGGKQQNKPPSGLGGLASSFLGGQSSHNTAGGSGSSSGGGGLAGQLMGSLLGGGKPQKPQSGASSGGGDIGVPGGSSSESHQTGGLMSMAPGFLGGHQKPPVGHSYRLTNSILISRRNRTTVMATRPADKRREQEVIQAMRHQQHTSPVNKATSTASRVVRATDQDNHITSSLITTNST